MAVTTAGIDKSVWNLVYEAGQPQRQLPWAFMNFGDLGEEGNRWVVPMPPDMSILSDLGDTPGPAGVRRVSGTIGEPFYAPFSPFPYEGGRVRSNSKKDEDTYAGPIAVHFFGGV